MVSAMETLSRESTYFPKVLGDSTFLGATHDHSSLLPLLAILVIASHSVLAILLNVYWLSHRDSIFIFLKRLMIGTSVSLWSQLFSWGLITSLFFVCCLAVCLSWRMHWNVLLFFKSSCCFFIIKLQKVLCIFWILDLFQIYVWEFFHLFAVSFCK